MQWPWETRPKRFIDEDSHKCTHNSQSSSFVAASHTYHCLRYAVWHTPSL
jgi:hypothetical protein